MKVTSVIARYFLGLIFLILGLNGFFHFLPMPPPTGVAAQFLGALHDSHYMVVIFLVQVIAAVLLLSNFYVPLALTFLGPVLVNIICFHMFMSLSGLPLALFTVILWFVCFFSVRSAFAGIFQQRAPAQT